MTESNNLGGDFLYQWTFPRVRFQEHFSYGKKLASISQNIRSLCWRHLCKKSWWCWWQAVECLHLHPPFRTNRQVFSLSVVINWEAVTIKGLQQCHCQDHEQTHSDLLLYDSLSQMGLFYSNTVLNSELRKFQNKENFFSHCNLN